MCPILFGANLLALAKKCGGIRPIAVGSVFRRTAAKIACASVVEALRPYLQPHQMGFGTPGGAEAIHRASRLFLESSEGVFAKLDFENAFNTVYRRIFLEEALDHVPSIYPLIQQSFAQPSHLLLGEFVIASEEGLQQGDPLAPLLFCLAIQPIIGKLRSKLNAAYLDDESLGGGAATVAADIAEVKSSSESIGLILNPKKCALLVMNEPNVAAIDEICRLLPGLRILTPGDCELLGAPLTDEALPAALEKKTQQIKLLAARLPLLASHASIFILKNCLSIPKMVYLLRCIPSWKAPNEFAPFGYVMRDALESITNSAMDDEAWFQASLPVAKGGLGIRSA